MRHYILLLATNLTPVFLFSQFYSYDNRYYDKAIVGEAGISVGGMNCLTDLGGGSGTGQSLLKAINWRQTRWCGSVYAAALIHYIIGVRLEATFGTVTASDHVLKNSQPAASQRYQRNLQFRSPVAELSLLAEWYPAELFKDPPLFSPYLLAGVGLFSFNPQAKYNGSWISLHPLHTEGQGFKEYPRRKEYALTQINFPLGIGLKYELSALFNLRFEIVHRVLCTDYLDDVSRQYIDPEVFYRYFDPGKAALAVQLADRRKELDPSAKTLDGQVRGNPGRRDAYFSFNLKEGWIFNRKRW